MPLLLGIDIGTSGTKIIIMDENGGVVASATETYPLHTPRPNWAEQDPHDWWAATCAAIRRACESGGADPADVGCVGLTGQMHGLVLLDEDDEVLRPAILWCDQRTAEECRWITGAVGGEQRLRELTCNTALTGFTAPKIVWVRDHEPDVYGKIRKMLLPKDYMRLRLTGEYATEVSDASGTLLFDVANRRWSHEVTRALGVREEWLPSCHESPEITGGVTRAVARETGLAEGTPVVGGGGDQAEAAVGRSAGIDPYDLITAEAAQAEPGCEGLVFLPYVAGERTPYPDPNARGVFFGLSLRHTKAHMARAVMEGVAFSLRDCLELVRALGVSIEEVRVSGGGARSSLWRQIIADVFGSPLVTLGVTEGPAYGAALLAGVGIGVYGSVAEACEKTIKPASVTEPSPSTVALYEEYYGMYRALYPQLKPAFDQAAEIVSRGR